MHDADDASTIPRGQKSHVLHQAEVRVSRMYRNEAGNSDCRSAVSGEIRCKNSGVGTPAVGPKVSGCMGIKAEQKTRSKIAHGQTVKQ